MKVHFYSKCCFGHVQWSSDNSARFFCQKPKNLSPKQQKCFLKIIVLKQMFSLKSKSRHVECHFKNPDVGCRPNPWDTWKKILTTVPKMFRQTWKSLFQKPERFVKIHYFPKNIYFSLNDLLNTLELVLRSWQKVFCRKSGNLPIEVWKEIKTFKYQNFVFFFKILLWTRRMQRWQPCRTYPIKIWKRWKLCIYYIEGTFLLKMFLWTRRMQLHWLWQFFCQTYW